VHSWAYCHLEEPAQENDASIKAIKMLTEGSILLFDLIV
jgi:hypothetical protein